jgi:hypothetical protein
MSAHFTLISYFVLMSPFYSYLFLSPHGLCFFLYLSYTHVYPAENELKFSVKQKENCDYNVRVRQMRLLNRQTEWFDCINESSTTTINKRQHYQDVTKIKINFLETSMNV